MTLADPSFHFRIPDLVEGLSFTLEKSAAPFCAELVELAPLTPCRLAIDADERMLFGHPRLKFVKRPRFGIGAFGIAKGHGIGVLVRHALSDKVVKNIDPAQGDANTCHGFVQIVLNKVALHRSSPRWAPG